MTVGLSDADERELAVLRRRAYGPDGRLDPAGERRLRDLEDRVVEAQAPVGDVDDPTPLREALPETDLEPDDLPAEIRRSPGRRALVGVGAVVAAALLVGTGYALGQPRTEPGAGTLEAVDADPERAAVVAGTASFAVLDLEPDSLVQYSSLGQGTPWSATDPDGGRCLILTVTDDSLEMIARAGVWDVECAPAGLDPLIDWEVDPSFPSPPQDLPDGSVVRLTLHDDRVLVSIGRTG